MICCIMNILFWQKNDEGKMVYLEPGQLELFRGLLA